MKLLIDIPKKQYNSICNSFLSSAEWENMGNIIRSGQVLSDDAVVLTKADLEPIEQVKARLLEDAALLSAVELRADIKRNIK